MGFVQGGSSYLAREGVQMPLTREEAKTYNLQNIIKPKSNNSK
jgi:hypothetical protein